MISVCIATYNGGSYIGEQLRSVLLQLKPEDEVVVSDDGSTDDTFAVIAELGDARIRLLQSCGRLGVVKNFERALLSAHGDIIFLCDQDDVWLPGKYAQFSSAFDSDPQILVIVSDAQVIDDRGTITASSFMAIRGGFSSGLASTLMRNRYLGCAMALRRELIVAALPIPQWVPMHDMWLGALGSMLGKVHYISTPLLQYRRHSSNASPSSRQGWLQMLRWRMALLTLLVARYFSLLLRLHRSVKSSNLSNQLRS
jgi:glycosyltransferase involved in cell wall biosynthesis